MKCKVCKNVLESILDNENFVIDYYCSKCILYWNYEDIREKKQKKLDIFLK